MHNFVVKETEVLNDIVKITKYAHYYEQQGWHMVLYKSSVIYYTFLNSKTLSCILIIDFMPKVYKNVKQFNTNYPLSCTD